MEGISVIQNYWMEWVSVMVYNDGQHRIICMNA